MRRTRNGLSPLTSLVAAVVVVVLTTTPTWAASIRKSDPQPECSQAAPLDVRNARFTYEPDAYVVRVKMGELSRKKTRVIARMTDRGDSGVDVILSSQYVGNKKKVVGHYAVSSTGEAGRFTRGVTAAWDFSRDTITFTLTRYLDALKIFAAAYSVPKGADHGDICGDYITVPNLKRG